MINRLLDAHLLEQGLMEMHLPVFLIWMCFLSGLMDHTYITACRMLRVYSLQNKDYNAYIQSVMSFKGGNAICYCKTVKVTLF